MNLKVIVFAAVSFLAASCGAGIPRFTSEANRYPESKETSGKVESVPDKELDSYNDVVPLDIFTGTASYYADQYNGKKTSNGEVYDMNALTAASNDLPFNTVVRVTNLANNKSVILRINDRGGLKRGRIIDVSLEAAKRLNMLGSGTAEVRIEVLKYGDRPK